MLGDAKSAEHLDIGLLNLLCASGLPGAGNIEVDRYVAWLDDSAGSVKRATEENNHKFLDAPAAYHSSYARFCTLCLVTVLQRQCGVHYNPKWKEITPDCPIPESFGADARDVFIHAIIDGIGGTCGSLPVLYVAIGRRLGYPLKIVKAPRHLFVRWDDPEGKLWHHPDRFNIEATGPGVHFLPDEHYRTWPHRIPDEDVRSGIFLRSLSRAEELAEFMATRAYCLRSNQCYVNAVAALADAVRLAPNNRHFAVSYRSLEMHLAMRRRGHAFLNAPIHAVPGMDDLPEEPFWLGSFSGAGVLVQIPRAGFRPPTFHVDSIRQLVDHFVFTPGGQYAQVRVPVHGSGPPMTAHWLRLHDGRYALIHKPVTDPLFSSQQFMPGFDERRGQPILPENENTGRRRSPHFHPGQPLHRDAELLPQEQTQLLNQIDDFVNAHRDEQWLSALPSMQPLALPAGPAAPRVPGTSRSPLLIP